jgi:hypothetical protein
MIVLYFNCFHVVIECALYKRVIYFFGPLLVLRFIWAFSIFYLVKLPWLIKLSVCINTPASKSCQIVIGYNWINLCKTRIPIRLSIWKIAMSPMTLGGQFTLLSKRVELSKKKPLK